MSIPAAIGLQVSRQVSRLSIGARARFFGRIFVLLGNEQAEVGIDHFGAIGNVVFGRFGVVVTYRAPHILLTLGQVFTQECTRDRHIQAGIASERLPILSHIPFK